MLKKLRSESGESLVEILVAIVILTLSMSMLATGLGSAAKVTSAIPVEDTVFKTDGTSQQCVVTITVDGNSVEMTRVGHVTENGYYYYD